MSLRRTQQQAATDQPSTSSPDSFEWTENECLKRYMSSKSAEVLFAGLEKREYEKIVRLALKANKKALKCIMCPKEFNAASTLLLHLKKCIPRIGDCEERLERNEPILGPVYTSKGRPAKGRNKATVEIKTLSHLEEEPTLWLRIDRSYKRDLLKKLFGDGPYPCFASKPNDQVCQPFRNADDAINHLDKCIKPTYLTLMGNSSTFVLLPKQLRARYIKEAFTYCGGEVPCLACDRRFTHAYGLQYHVERCNVSDDIKPWKCYRCGYSTVKHLSDDHLAKCPVSLYEESIQRDLGIDIRSIGSSAATSMNEDEMTTTMSDSVRMLPKTRSSRSGGDVHASSWSDVGALGNLKWEGSLCKRPDIEMESESGVHAQFVKRSRQRASVSNGNLLSSGSTMGTPSHAGTASSLRYRFKKSQGTDSLLYEWDWEKYQNWAKESDLEWQGKFSEVSVCKSLQDIPASNFALSNPTDEDYLQHKSSVGFRLMESNQRPVFPPDYVPDDCCRLEAFSSAVLKTLAEIGEPDVCSIAYAGGPVHSICFAPNSVSEDEEVFVVCTFPDDELLIGSEWREGKSVLQLWTLKKSSGTNKLSCKLLLKTDHGAILCATWLDRPRPADDISLIGYLAVGTAGGAVLIYRIDKSIIGSELRVTEQDAHIVLIQPTSTIVDTGRSCGDDSECLVKLPPPVIRLAWCSVDQAQHVLAVNASGAVAHWNLNENHDEPLILSGLRSNSPTTDVCYVKDFEVALAFRDRCTRLYDIRSWACIVEEATARTAGIRVISEQRTLPGFFTFQGEFMPSQTQEQLPISTISYVATDEKQNGYFVVPAPNEHELMLWDAAVSPQTGLLASCGADGQLIFSANGRIAPSAAKKDLTFVASRSALRIIMNRCCKRDEEGNPIISSEAVSEYQDVCKSLYLDVILQPSVVPIHIPYASLDLRISSLNTVAANRKGTPVILTAGQAGLIFCRPCDINSRVVHSDAVTTFAASAVQDHCEAAAKKICIKIED